MWLDDNGRSLGLGNAELHGWRMLGGDLEDGRMLGWTGAREEGRAELGRLGAQCSGGRVIERTDGQARESFVFSFKKEETFLSLLQANPEPRK